MRSPLYTVGNLEIPASQMQWIQQFRQQNDPRHRVVEPHFTMVFGVGDLDEGVYLSHIEAVARASRTIEFRCRYAMLGADDMDDTAYVFLVPNEGNAEISLLHDDLYRGVLEPYHRLKFPYIPHITIASTKDFMQAKLMCDQLNRSGVLVQGRISSLTTGVLRDGALQTLRTFPLSA
ncbi:2'-5' RNA ligase family protein [Ideonella sp. YS5]|uniref:2'-5' RNA ligase family protein n=1 Tax=Ideonella sp. YS5 TaxID=3453714 RepID=UPI003EF08AC8